MPSGNPGIKIIYTKWPQNRPNGHKMYQRLPLQKHRKFAQIGIFGFENMPSGNPGIKIISNFFRHEEGEKNPNLSTLLCFACKNVPRSRCKGCQIFIATFYQKREKYTK
jgi:hypothetical protein